MRRRFYLVNTIGIGLVLLALACADGPGNGLPADSDSGSPASDQQSEHWRLVITRRDSTIETVLSSEQPIICGSQEEPKVLFFCGRGIEDVDGRPPPFWDFLPVNTGAGDTYTIEPPERLTPGPTPTTPTPTVIHP